MTTPHTVWVLEDNREDATLIARALARTGVPLDVRTLGDRGAFDEEVATSVDQGRAPLLVVSDSRIPGLHHLDALRTVAEHWPDALFVLCSGSGSQQDGERVRELGALGMLRKPDVMQLPLIARAALEGVEAKRRCRELEAEKHRVEQQLEARVEERTRALNELNRELESFSYTVSHDLRAPLRHISAFSQILKAEHAQQLTPAAGEVVDRIQRAAQRMSRMIDGMLELARHTQESMERREVDMNALVHDELDARAGEAKGAHLDVSTLPPCMGDRVLLARVWSNLIGNALKYSARSPAPRIAIDGVVAGAEAIYCVRDNGVGFDMQYAEKLFGMFQRLHASGEFEGVGMGLAIVHKILQRHGGRIWAEAKPNGGATFCFALPAVEA